MRAVAWVMTEGETMIDDPRMRHFRRAWQAAQVKSWCDAWGGIECRRVYREWAAAGWPGYCVRSLTMTMHFIRRAANRPAVPPSEAGGLVGPADGLNGTQGDEE